MIEIQCFRGETMAITFGLYALLATITVFATVRAAHYVDELDKKTRISGALIGGVLLATVTSLPEFITTITATVVLDSPGLAFGNVFGSNLFNILILAVVDLVFIKHLFFNKTNTGVKTNTLVIFMYMVFALPLVLNRIGLLDYDQTGITIGLTFSVISLAIIGIYVFALRSMSKELPSENESTSTYSLKHILIGFTAWAVVVVVTSYFVTVVTNTIAIELNMSASFAGAIFLGVATSLPEFTAVITLFKLKNYAVALGNILGSSVFNMMIISVVDVINIRRNIFDVLSTDMDLRKNISLLLILGLVNSIIVGVALVRKPPKNKFIYGLPSIIIIISYLVYIGLSL